MQTNRDICRNLNFEGKELFFGKSKYLHSVRFKGSLKEYFEGFHVHRCYTYKTF